MKDQLTMKERHLLDRRNFLLQSGAGLCSIALSSMLAEDGFASGIDDKPSFPDPLAPKAPHHKPRAKSVIWLFLEGGPSHLDTFDPKPKLLELAGKPMPESFGRPITAMGTASNTIMPSKRLFKQSGQSARIGRISKAGPDTLRWAAVEAVQRVRGGPIGSARARIGEHRGANIGKVAAARKLLTLVFYGLRDGHIRCLTEAA